MPGMPTLVDDPVSSFPSSVLKSGNPNESKINAVQQTVQNMLGVYSSFQGSQSTQFAPTGLTIYDTLGKVLSFSPQTAFFWETVAQPFASMLDTANYPPQAQTTFLVFVYARVLGLMGPPHRTDSVMTHDGSSTELSWVIPQKGPSKAGQPNRSIRFAVEPLDPITGKPLAGHDILNYLTSEEGSLGVVKSDDESMEWWKAINNFLHPNTPSGTIPKGGRFFVGFDFEPTGVITLKAYFCPRVRPPTQVSLNDDTSIFFQDDDFRPLKRLVNQLHPSMSKALGRVVEYFETLEKDLRPYLTILAVDCVPSHRNRLKIYFHTKKGTSFSNVKDVLTLGGRDDSTQTSKALEVLKLLWTKLFPAVPPSSDLQLGDTAHPIPHKSKVGSHPLGGMTYYYELVYGEETVYPKVYLPVQNYCANDQEVARAIEEFYDAVETSRGSVEKGWVEREVARAYKQRPLSLHTGIHTYVTFALKRSGWDLTSYFSPESWVWLQRKQVVALQATPRL